MNNYSKTTLTKEQNFRFENTRNKANYDFSSKFNSHTIQWNDRNTSNNLNKDVRKRSISKSKPSVETKKKETVSNYIRKSIESISWSETENISSSLEKQLISDYHNLYMKDIDNKNNYNQHSKRPKISRPTKTIIMNIWDEKSLKFSENSLRNSKESLSLGCSVISKATPQNNITLNKHIISNTTKPTTIISSDKTKDFSSTATSDANKSEKVVDRNNTLKNCKSQVWFQKNPVYSTNKANRLKKLKHNLDKQQHIINEINNIKGSIHERKLGKQRSNSRNHCKNEDLKDINKENCAINKWSRSRSKTDFESKPKQQDKKNTKKTNIYTLNENKNSKLSRNDCKEPANIKTKSFLKPSTNSTTSVYKAKSK